MWRSRKERRVRSEVKWHHRGFTGLLLILLLLFSAADEVVGRFNGRLLLQRDHSTEQPTETSSPTSPPAPTPSSAPSSLSSPLLESHTTKAKSSSNSIEEIWWVFLAIPAFFVLLLFSTICCLKRHAERRRNAFASKEIFVARRRQPWKAGMTGTMRKRIKKITITEVPLNTREELEHECEEFSNIIDSSSDSILFKGTRDSGAQIAVARVQTRPCLWTAGCELNFLRKVQDVARMKHPNVISLLAYCSEDEPFERMVVFEYAPNGTVYEQLHSPGAAVDPLDWAARMKIIMGSVYGLNYMHSELNPPVSHLRFDSSCVYLTEGYSAKVAAHGLMKLSAGSNALGRRESFGGIVRAFSSDDWQVCKPENTVYSLGLFLLEMISGRCPNEDGVSILQWASEYMETPEKYRKLVDPSLPSHDASQLATLIDVIKQCTKKPACKRPTMASVTELLAAALKVSLEEASLGSSGKIDFKSSPLTWAKLELLTSESGHSSTEEEEENGEGLLPLLPGGPSSPKASPRASPLMGNRSFSRVSPNSPKVGSSSPKVGGTLPKVGSSSGDDLSESHRVDEVAINMTSTQVKQLHHQFLLLEEILLAAAGVFNFADV
ncbi:hypothetical protein R1sor_022199 [Riccia sorocarpa]|uniref:Protein kinase domain-containing protein n=1 Tax=Riccia sorocarpa TaxID=122646 RepID=A0ABD3GJ64_9MARC